MRVPFLIACICVVLSMPPPAAAADGYRLPVDAPVVDKFRAPATPYSQGNRGWEYQLPDGTSVVAAADATVTFSGVVAGTLNVVLRDREGLLLTYSRLSATSLHVGQQVRRGEVVGTSTAAFYFGVRRDGRYFDPAQLFGQVRLVPFTGGAAAPGPPAPRPPAPRHPSPPVAGNPGLAAGPSGVVVTAAVAGGAGLAAVAGAGAVRVRRRAG